MNILYDFQIFSEQSYGGPSRYFFNLALEVLKSEQVKICAPIHFNEYLKEFPEANKFGFKMNNFLSNILPYKVKRLIKKEVINKINYFYQKKIINSFSPDLIHRTYYDDYKIKKLPVVLTVYDLIHEKFHHMYGEKSNFRPKKKAIERADRIICISKNTLHDLDYYYDIRNKKTEVIYLASDLKDRDNIIPDNIKKSHKNYLLYVGKRSGYKNFINFIKAYSLSKKLCNDFEIICFGGGKWRKSESIMLRKFGVHNQINLIESNNDDDLISLYKNAKALVYPSQYEGFGLPVLEAMSFGCPVICSSSSSLPEVGGIAVEYFDPHIPQDLCEKLENILNSESHLVELKNKGLIRSKSFSWKKCSDETRQIYKSLI
jgi:glycosyltransferase involved in cell wall biosynthesis